MEDSLRILLQAELDKSASTDNINKQIKRLSKGLEKLSIKINFDDNLLKDLNAQIADITKKMGQSNVKVGMNTTELEKAKSVFKELQGEMISLKEKIRYDKEGNQITQLVSKFKMLDGTIKTITQNASGKTLNEQTEKNLGKIQAEREKALQQEQSIRNEIANKEQQSIVIAQQQEELQAKINSKLKEVQTLKSNTTDNGEITRLNKISDSLNNIKSDASDAKHQLALASAELKDFKIDQKQSDAFKKLKFDIEQFQNTTKSKLQKMFDIGKIDFGQFNKFTNAVDKISPTTENARQKMVALRNEIANTSRGANTGASGIKKFVSNLLQMAGIGSVLVTLQNVMNVAKQLTVSVMELDSAMISLQRVSSGTSTVYEDFKNNMFQVANSVGSTATDMINSAKEFSQLGYSLEEAGVLAENASKLATAGEMSIEKATSNITSALTAFNLEIDESGRLIDVFNRIGNTMAITSEGIGEGLARSANALAQANNSLEESVALISATNKTLQNPEVAGRGWRTISMRLRGISEDGEELDAKLGEIIEKYTGVKIFNEANQEFESTYKIVTELSKVWNTLTDAQQAFLAEKIAGKNQAEVLLSALNNGEDLIKGLEEAQNALGTTEEEMSLVMDSWEAKTNQLKNAWLEFGQTVINSEFVKGLVDGLTKIVQGITSLVDDLDKLTPILGTVLTLITAIKAQSVFESITKSIPTIKALGTSLSGLVGLFGNATSGAMSFSSVMSALNLNPTVLMISALAGGLLLLKQRSDEAREAQLRLEEQRKQNLENLKQEVSGTENIRNSYDEINKSAMTRAERAKELAKLQLELINTYGAEASGVDLVNDGYAQNIGKLDELIAKKKEYLAQELADRNDSLETNAMDAKTVGGDFLNGAVYKMDDTQVAQLELIIEQLNKVNDEAKISSVTLDDLFGKKRTLSFVGDINNSLELMKMTKDMMKGTSLEGTDLYNNLADSISEMSDISMEYNANELQNLQIQSELMANEAMRTAGIEDLNNATEDQINACSDYINSLSEASDESKKLALSLLGIENASESGGFDSISSKLNSLVKTSEECEEAVGKIETAMADLTGILEDLDAGNGITSASLKKIISNYPDLLQCMNDEGQLREKLKEKMDEYSSQYKGAMRDLLSASEHYYNEENAMSETYYKEKILQNQDTCTALQQDLKALYDALGVMYDLDLQNYTNVDQLKAQVTEDLINSLQTAWSDYFKNVGNKFKEMSALSSKAATVEKLTPTNPYTARKIKSTLPKGESALDKMFRLSEGVASEVPDEIAKITSDLNNTMSQIGDTLGKYTFDPVSIKVGGSKAPSSGGKKKDKKDSQKYASYVESLYSSIIESYENGSEKLAQEIEVASKRIENAQAKNGLGLDEDALLDGSLNVSKVFENASKLFEKDSDFSILEKKYADASTAIAKHSENLRNLRKQIVSDLSKKGYSELKGIDLQNIQQFQVDKIIRNLEQQIEKAEVASNEKLKASLEYKRDLIEDYAGNIININQRVNELASEYQDAMSTYADAVVEHINQVYDGIDNVIDKQMTQLSTMQDYLRNSDNEGWLKNQAQQIDLIVAKEQSQLKRIQEYKKQGYDEDSELMQEAYDTYYSYYQERLALVKEEGEKRIEIEKETQEKVKEQLENDKESIETLLDLTLEMLKQNINDQIEALEERKDATLQNIKEEQEAYEEAIDNEVDMYKKLIEAKKEALNQEYDEYTYNKDVEEATKQISVLENKIETLSKDSSAKAQAQIAEYKEQLADAKEALYELQYKHSIEEQERALDKELDDYEALKDSEKDSHLEYLDEKYEATEKEFDDEIDALKRQLDEEGRLRQQAMELIESKSDEFYEGLMEWNSIYGDGLSSTVQTAWDNCYSALENYNNGQLNVSSTLDTIISQLEQCENIINSLDNAEWQDYVDGNMTAQDYSSSKLEESTKTSASSSDSSKATNNGNSDRKNLQKYYHNLMEKAKKENNEGLVKWVKSERKKNKFNPDTGADLQKYHIGLEKGRVGDGLKPDEIIAKLTKSEWVLTGKQMRNLTENAKTLTHNNSQPPQISLQVDKIMEVGSIEKDVDINALMNQMSEGLTNIITKNLTRTMNKKFGW